MTKSTSKAVASPVKLQDVAAMAGISLTTASMALNGKGRVARSTQQEVQRIAREMGFQAHPSAQRLSSGRCNTLIDLLSFQLDSGLVLHKLKTMQALLMRQGFVAPIHALDSDVPAAMEHKHAILQNILRQGPCAIVCSIQGLPQKFLEELQRYMDSGGVIVACDFAGKLACDQVVFDRSDSADRAVTHLLELGHREIAFAMSNLRKETPRLQGVHRAFKRYGLTANQEYLLDCEMETSLELTGQTLAERFLAMKRRPRAICIPDDIMAAAFIAHLFRQGVRVPEDVSVVSHDDLPIAAHNFIPISTVAQPALQIAQAVVDLLHTRLSGEYSGPARTVTIHGELIPRCSTGPPPKSR